MIEWHTECRTDDDKIIDWEKNERYFWVTSIFYSHSGLIPSFLMRKNEKNQIPPTRDQKIVTLDWMNSILNDGKAEGRGNFLNKGQPLRFFSSSFHSYLTVFSSFHTHSLSEISVEWVRQSIPPNPLCRGGWGEWIDALIQNSSYTLNESEMMQQHWIEWYYIIQYSFSISDEIRTSATIQSPQPPLQRGLGGMDWRTHSKLILLTEWNKNECDNPIPPTPSAEGVGGNGLTH